MRFLRGSKKQPFSDINVVPYIDVSLVLLLVFMITAPLIEQGVEVNLPKANANQISAIEEEPVVITIDLKGQLFINLSENPQQPTTPNEMVALVTAVRRVNPDLPVLIRGEKTSLYGNIVSVMAILQRAGIEKLGLMTEGNSG